MLEEIRCCMTFECSSKQTALQLQYPYSPPSFDFSKCETPFHAVRSNGKVTAKRVSP